MGSTFHHSPSLNPHIASVLVTVIAMGIRKDCLPQNWCNMPLRVDINMDRQKRALILACFCGPVKLRKNNPLSGDAANKF